MQRTHERIEDITAEEWDRTFRTNIYSQFYLCKAAIPHMKPGAAIVNTTSINAKNPSPSLLAYATTKGAIANFTAGLAQSVADRGIRVNCVAPGPIWTPLIPSTMPKEAVETFGQNTPLGRAGQPAELAPAYVLLASDEASYMTGALVPVTGGRPISESCGAALDDRAAPACSHRAIQRAGHSHPGSMWCRHSLRAALSCFAWSFAND